MGKVHGDRGTRLYRVWQGMKSRCLCKSRYTFCKSYVSLGITVCEEWASSYLAFKEWALQNGYADNLEIDRINNLEGYKPSNCRFVTRHENLMNRRNTIFINYNGRDIPLKDACEELGIPYKRAYDRYKSGFPADKVLSKTKLSRY